MGIYFDKNGVRVLPVINLNRKMDTIRKGDSYSRQSALFEEIFGSATLKEKKKVIRARNKFDAYGILIKKYGKAGRRMNKLGNDRYTKKGRRKYEMKRQAYGFGGGRPKPIKNPNESNDEYKLRATKEAVEHSRLNNMMKQDLNTLNLEAILSSPKMLQAQKDRYKELRPPKNIGGGKKKQEDMMAKVGGASKVGGGGVNLASLGSSGGGVGTQRPVVVALTMDDIEGDNIEKQYKLTEDTLNKYFDNLRDTKDDIENETQEDMTNEKSELYYKYDTLKNKEKGKFSLEYTLANEMYKQRQADLDKQFEAFHYTIFHSFPKTSAEHQGGQAISPLMDRYEKGFIAKNNVGVDDYYTLNKKDFSQLYLEETKRHRGNEYIEGEENDYPK